MLKRLFITFILFGGLTGAAYAGETDWSVHIKVSVPDSRGGDGTLWNHLIAGTREGATDGLDRAWDTLSMVETDDPVQSMFTHGVVPEDKNGDGMIDGWVCKAPEGGYTDRECSLWRDVKAFASDKVWSFLVLSPLNDVTVTLKWSFEDKPRDMEILLVDLANPAGGIDMLNGTAYSYTSYFETGKKYGIRFFEIRMKAKGLFITPPELPDATVYTPYHGRLTAVGGAPLWSLADGELPPGMYLDPGTGEIAGTPTVAGVYHLTVKGEDPVSGYISSRGYTLNIHSIPEIGASGLPDGVAGMAYYAQMTLSGGSAPFVWDVRGNLPEGLTFNTGAGLISGTALVPGIYDFTVTVKDANGATDSRDYRITVVEPDDKNPPERIDDLGGISVTETSMILIWSAPADDSMTGTAALYDIRYLEDCPSSQGLNDDTWDSAVEVSGEPRPQAGALQTYTFTGIKPGTSYCVGIRSLDASGNLSELSNILTLPLSTDSYKMAISGFSDLTSSVLLRRGYNLISVPLIPVPNDRESLFGIIVDNPVALYRWYSAYPGITPPRYYLEDSVQPGYGYFLYSTVDNIPLTIYGLTIEEPSYNVLLQSGWNMIGLPYTRPVLLRDVLVRNKATGEERSYIDAVKMGWIGNSLYQLKVENYDFVSFNDDPPAVLEPWVGYWIYVNGDDGVEIKFRRP